MRIFIILLLILSIKLDKKKRINYNNNIIDCIKLSTLLEHFKSNNIKKKGD